MVVTPKFICLVCWHVLDLTPLLLQGLKLLITLVGILWSGYHGLYLFDDGKFLCKVLLLLGLLLLKQLGAFLLNDTHLCFECLFLLVGSDLVLLWVTASIDVGLETGFALCYVQLIEGGLQIVHLLFLGRIIAMSNLPDTFQDFCLGLINLARGFYLRSFFLLCCLFMRNLFLTWRFYCSGRFLNLSFCGLWGHFFLHHFVVTHFEGILLRVHHLTSLVTDTNSY